MKFLEVLFSFDFVTRDCCGSWHPFFIYLYVIANAAIFAAYGAITLTLIGAKRQTAEWAALNKSQKDEIRDAFAKFILFCGIGHLEGCLSFLAAPYHLWAVYDMATAVVSWQAFVVIRRHRDYILSGV